MSDTLNKNKLGAWLPWPVVETLLQLRLRPASQWQVFLTVLCTSARYGNKDAKLGIDDICRITGLAPRTVKGAVSALCKSGLLVRVRRSRLLRVPLLQHNTVAIDRHHKSPFTSKQDATISPILTRINDLHGIDGLSLIIPTEFAARLGYLSPTSYALAYEELKSIGTRSQAGIFVESLMALCNYESVQGRELV